MKKAIIIDAILPKKFLTLLGNKTVLHRIIERCQQSSVKEIIVITANNNCNSPVTELCEWLKIPIFHGTNTKSHAIHQCAEHFNLDLIIEISANCPLIDPGIINKLIDIYEIDYASNIINPSFPAGFDVQVYSFKALKRLLDMSKLNPDINLENTGLSFAQLAEFKKLSLSSHPSYYLPDWNLALNTPKDYELINWIYSIMKDEIWNYKQIIDFLKKNIINFISYNSADSIL